jgi:hypothetical protein
MTRQWHVYDRFPISDNPEPEITVGNGLISPGGKMSNLVARARGGMDGPPYPRNIQTELADEIERLRSALKMVVTDLGEGVDPQEVRACVLDVLNYEIIKQRSP